MVHKDVLCFHSKLFADGFTGNSEEARTGVLNMEDVHPEVFGTLVHYIYTQKIQLNDEDEDNDNIKSEDDDEIKSSVAEKLTMLSDLWQLAGGCMMPTLQNDCMKMLFPLLNYLDADSLRDMAIRVYNGSEEMSQLKKAVVERVAFGLNEDELSDWMAGPRKEQLPDGMLVDLVMVLKRCAAVEVELSIEHYFV
jgi:hypothetical protein